MDYYNWYVCWWQQEYQGGFWTWRHEGVTNIEHLIEHGMWFDVQNQDQHYIINLLNGWDNNNNSSPPVSEFQKTVYTLNSRRGFQILCQWKWDPWFQIPIVSGIPDSECLFGGPKAQDSCFHKQKYSGFRIPQANSLILQSDYIIWGKTMPEGVRGRIITRFWETAHLPLP